MPWTMRHHAGGLTPDIRCDACGSEVSSAGYVAWAADWSADEPRRATVSIACSQECVETIATSPDVAGEWVATPLDVYLASLVHSLGIDVDEVLRMERASLAAERTRDQSPE
jgi:hypothetical protein